MKETTHNIHEAVNVIKTAILQSQLKVAREGNRMLLALYYGVGRYVSNHSRDGYWGKGAIEAISNQLQKEMPGLRGFSSANIKKMRIFYEQWMILENRSPVANEIEKDKSVAVATDLELIECELPMICQAQMANLSYDEFVSVSFTHHMEILFKCKSLEERLFYIHQTCLAKWDKYKLREVLKADLYHHLGSLPNNFASTMPDKVSALKAIEMFKDEYLLDFMNVEELGARDMADVDERVMEQQIVHNIKNFIMTFGQDFTFVGNQYHLEKFNHDLYPDLLFFNRELACLVAVELKRGEFKPAYLGQLSAYLRVLDAEVKKPFENPSIGIVLCKNADKSYVEFLIQGYDNPMGVATYKTKDDIIKLLPPEEELIKLLKEE